MIQKHRTGESAIFRWVAPEPLAPDTTPTITVEAGGVAVAGLPAMQVIAGPASIVAAPERGQRTLTASAAVSNGARVTIDHGECFYITDEDGERACRVRSVNGTAITVTEVFTPAVAPGGVLQWREWWVKFTSADVTATARRDMTWSVTYTPLYEGSTDGEDVTKTDGPYQLIVVDNPFDTGVTSRDLRAFYSEVAQSTPSRDDDRSVQIEIALDWMINEIRAELKPKGYWEDDVDGQGFKLPHVFLTASLIFEGSDPERATELRQRYHSTLETALRHAQVDLDQDGVPDEEPTRASGPPTLRALSMSQITPASPYRRQKWGPWVYR